MSWFKIHRCLFEKEIWKGASAETKVVMVTLLSECVYKKSVVVFGGKSVTLNPGQYVTSFRILADVCGVSYQNVRTALKHLEKFGFLSMEKKSYGTLITINNWCLYQSTQEVTQEVTQDKTLQTSHGSEFKKLETSEPTHEVTQQVTQNLTQHKEIKEDKELYKRESARARVLVNKDISADVEQVKQSWNKLGLRQVKTMDAQREKKIVDLLIAHSLEDVLDGISQVNTSDFLKGENKSGWKATLDWFCDNFSKVADGNYDNGIKTNGNKFNNFEQRTDNDIYDQLEKKSMRKLL